ncbi:MAG: D-alanyl-D-alanine carboxypeptidase family protein, partial [Lachnospiraceae bacterium]|nr:D-alanyl-D-alanine carboxypeptidase family protein [Lachnospiraceae bacterium]
MQEVHKKENAVRRKKRQQKQKEMQKRVMLLCMVMFLLGVFCGKIVFAKEDAESVSVSETISTIVRESDDDRVNINDGRVVSAEDEEDWKLVLVNSTHFMEDGYTPQLAEIENNYYVDARIVENLHDMLAAGRAAGLDFWICSAYRTMEKQTSLYENKVQRLMQEKGISYEKAYEEAGNTVAYPGTSEHQLGLA